MAEAREPGVVTRLYVEEHLSEGSTVALGRDRAHYLKNVLRADAGRTVALFNGRDGEWRARIADFAKHGAALVAETQIRAQAPEPDLWLVFAPIKRARLDYVAEKAVELGVSGLWPVFTQHTAMSRVNRERLVTTSIEAAEQSERLSVPEVFEPARLDEVLARWPAERQLVFCDESGGGGPIADVLRQRDLKQPHAILTGPEGGFARAELDALHKLPFVTPVGLGPRVLRADTAALAALAIFQALAQDRLGLPPPRFRARS